MGLILIVLWVYIEQKILEQLTEGISKDSIAVINNRKKKSVKLDRQGLSVIEKRLIDLKEINKNILFWTKMNL
ncbi:hypothetical protein ACQVQY_23180 [Bacillus mycoides]